MKPYTFPAVLALAAFGLIATGCQQTAPPQQTSTAPAQTQSQPAPTQTETTTQSKSVEVIPSPNPADPDSSGSKMVKKESTTVKKQQ